MEYDLIGYKVVTKDLKSIVHSNSSIAVQYKVNKWVYPTINNALMCFSDLNYAKKWRDAWGGFTYKCECILEPNPIFITQNISSKTVIKISKAISILQKYGYNLPSKVIYAPEGTIFCSQIKLLERVD